MTEATLAARALAFWDLPGARIELAARRENVVFRVTSKRGVHALRLHRRGYRTEAHIAAEINFMATLSHAGLRVPAPLPLRDGGLWIELDGILIDVLAWAPGAMLAAEAPAAERAACHRALGREMARLHTAADAWRVPDGFDRPAWNLDGLTGPEPLWGRAEDHPDLSAAERGLILDALALSRERLITARPDFGLIHADLVLENVLFDQGRPWLIDFDDFGWGYRAFELATALCRAEREPDYEATRAALIEGYLDERALDLTLLETFMTLRAFTYLGWITPRIGEPGAVERSARFVANALRRARGLLG